jgi:hypothetical protein
MLGEHDRELTAARRARKQYPDLLTTLEFEARALAALGRVDEVSRLLDQAGNFTPGSASINDPGLTAGLLAIWSGLELLAHGDSTAAENAFARSVSWYQRLPEQQRNGQLMQYGRRSTIPGHSRKPRRCLTEPVPCPQTRLTASDGPGS